MNQTGWKRNRDVAKPPGFARSAGLPPSLAGMAHTLKASVVALTSSLLYRGFPTRPRREPSDAPVVAAPCRLAVGDPAGWQPALRRADGRWLPGGCEISWLGLLLVLTASAQPNRPLPPAGGPWNNDVLVYRMATNGPVEKLATFERAGVPTVARLQDGRLLAAHQHFPADNAADFDKVAVRFSSDEGKTWSDPTAIHVAELPEGMRFPFDPTLVPLPDGRVRLYFTGNYGRTFQNRTPAIHSAISTNGIKFTYEPGVRFAVANRDVIDCAVVLHRGVFHLYAPDQGERRLRGEPPGRGGPASRPPDGRGLHATSTNGLDFARVADVQLEGRRRWLGNAQSDGQVITFFGTDDSAPARPGQPRGGVWMGGSADGATWEHVTTLALTGADPGAVKLKAGGWLVVVTSPPVRNESPRRPPL